MRTFAIEKSKWTKCHINKGHTVGGGSDSPTLIFCVRLVSLHQIQVFFCFAPFLFVLLINYLQMLF